MAVNSYSQARRRKFYPRAIQMTTVDTAVPYKYTACTSTDDSVVFTLNTAYSILLLVTLFFVAQLQL